jgi:nucleotide-binding universal stress UspA family protein
MNKTFKLLIGYDGSDEANAALRDLKRAGLPHKVEAVVLTVADVIMPRGRYKVKDAPEFVASAIKKAHTRGMKEMSAAHSFSASACRQLKADFPSWKISPEVSADSPAWGLVKKADKWKPDLIVVGSHRHSTAERFIFGSVSQKVLVVETAFSVRVGRGGTENGISAVRLIIGVDGSPESQAAVHAVSGRLWPKGSAVRLVAVVDARLATEIVVPTPSIRRWVKRNDQDPRAWVHRMLESFKKKLTDSGLAVSTLAKEGDPKQILLKEAERWGADSIFLGSRGLGMVERVFLGSVSSAVVARAHCSVEVVHLKRS